MDEILSQDEINDLLSAVEMDDGPEPLPPFLSPEGPSDLGGADPGMGGAHRVSAKFYDFKRPDVFTKENIRALQLIHETFAMRLTTQLSGFMRAFVNVHVASVDQLTFEEFSRSIPNPTTLIFMEVAPLPGIALMEMDPTISFSMIDRLHGGEGMPQKDNRELTEWEQATLSEPLAVIPGFLTESWGRVLNLDPHMKAMESNIQFAQMVPLNEMVVLITLEFRIGDVEGMMNLCYPYPTLRPILHRLTVGTLHQTVTEPKPARSPLEIDALPFTVEVALPLGTAPYPNIKRLSVGDVLPIGTPEMTRVTLAFQGETPGPVAHSAAGNLCLGPLPPLTFTQKPPPPSLEVEIETTSQRVPPPNEPTNGHPNFRYPHGSRAGKSLSLANLLWREHPQSLALVLSRLPPESGADFLEGLPVECRSDVARRLVRMNGINPRVNSLMEEALGDWIPRTPERSSPTGGIDCLVDVLNQLSRSSEMAIMESLEEKDPELAEEIKKRMFVFEDLVILSDDGLKRFLKEINMVDLGRALRLADDEVREKVFRNLQRRTAKTVQKKMDTSGPLRKSVAEECQKRVMVIFRRLEKEGELNLGRPGDGDIWV